jgi:hypothetical protein
VPVDYAALLKKLPQPKKAAPAAPERPNVRSCGNGPVIGPWGDGAKNGELRYVSPSQLERFDPATEGGCERKWWFRYRLRLPDKRTKAKDLGTQVHAQLEHYLKTGESVLGDLVGAGRRFIPSPGKDLLVESEWGVPAWPGPVDAPVRSPVRAAGVPVVMKIDLMHARGSFLNDLGALSQDPAGTVEVRDWKTTAQIDHAYDDDGNLVSRGYAKRGDDLIKTWQMPAYGALALATSSEPVTHLRLSHGYFQTRGLRAASLRSALHAADEVRARWDVPAERLVERMKAVARATDVKDVPANAGRACEAYGGCPYREQCPRDKKLVLAVMLGKNKERNAMSLKALLKKKDATATTTETKKPAASEVEAEKAKLVAEERAAKKGGGITPPDAPKPEKTAEPHPPESSYATASGAGKTMSIKVEAACGHLVPLDQISKLPNGTIKHVGCPGGAKTELVPEPAATEEEPKVSEPEGLAPGDDCPVGGTQQKTPADAKKYACECGASVKIKKPSKMPDGNFYSMVPKHEAPGDIAVVGEPAEEKKLKKAAAEIETVETAEITTAVASPPEVAYQKNKVDEPLSKPAVAIHLYLDASEDGVALFRLERYAERLCAELCEKYGAADVRCAPNDSPLSFGKWAGALAAFARSSPPEPGAYVVASSSAVGMVVFEALAGMGLGRVVRGSK